MQLTDAQNDALGELINIGFGRAASALSTLVGQRVNLQAPDVGMFPINEMEQALTPISHGEITSVHQVFSGKLSGSAMLLLDNPSAATLAGLLAGQPASDHRLLDDQAREALIETANILLNAFIGSFGNLLKVHVSFSVPHLKLESLRRMIESLMVEEQDLEYALIVRVHFWLTQGDVSGYVILVMNIQSLDVLMDAMQTSGFLEG